jgi:Fe-S-cluster containining protein
MSDIVKRVQELLKLPQHLCTMCGKCCKIATFKGGLSYEEIKKLIENPDEDISQIEGAKDFLAIFEPYESIEKAKEVGAGLVERVLERFGKDSNTSFFHCKYIGENNSCLIHEDRPLLCRMYPIPHERTFYNPGCGFEEQGKKNWQEIEDILSDLKKKQ